MQLVSTKKRVAIGAGIAVLSLGIGTAAYAYFTTTGTGNGTAVVGTSTGVTIAQDAFTAHGGTAVALTPGGPSQGFGFTITNPSTGHQYVNTATVAVMNDGGSTPLALDQTTGLGITGCQASWFVLSNGTDTGASVTVDVTQDIAGSNSTYDYQWDHTAPLTIHLTNAAADQDGCKDATIKIAYTSN
jgi:hypothetical protein